MHLSCRECQMIGREASETTLTKIMTLLMKAERKPTTHLGYPRSPTYKRLPAKLLITEMKTARAAVCAARPAMRMLEPIVAGDPSQFCDAATDVPVTWMRSVTMSQVTKIGVSQRTGMRRIRRSPEAALEAALTMRLLTR